MADTLAQALATMRFRVRPGPYALVGLPRGRAAAALEAMRAAGAGEVVQVTLEPDVVTVIASESRADALAREAGARAELGYRLITFETPMTWDVVGFFALATGALAAVGVPLGAICGFDQDHFFVREKHLERARSALRETVCPEATDRA